MLYPWIRELGRWADSARENWNGRLWATMFFINRELKHHPGLPVKTRLWALRRGFLSESVPLFGLNEHNLEGYLSNWERLKTRSIDGKTGHVHRNKSLFYYVMGPEWGDKLPACYGVLRDGTVEQLPISEDAGTDILSCLDAAGAVVIRPREGSGGEDVHIVSATADGYTIDGTEVTRRDVTRLADGCENHMLTKYVEQGPFPRSLYPDSPNTLRIVTMVDPETRAPYIGAAVQRIGTRESAPVDNWSRGGIAANVDLETGALSTAVSYPNGTRRGEHESHPETGVQIRGERVPNWDSITAEILELSAFLEPITPYIGWDVLLTDDDGSFKIIEGNNWPDIDVIQPHVPLVADERNRRFFEYHGVI